MSRSDKSRQTVRQVRLHPTLWRTCRALANGKRLKIFRYVLQHSGCPVSSVASALDLPLSVASEYLRALNARGLLGVERVGRYVLYRVSPDTSIPETTPLLAALETSFLRHRLTMATIFHELTGFTHPRRVRIIGALGRFGALGFGELGLRTGISDDALRRHLGKLKDRGLVRKTSAGYLCTRPKGVLPRVLMNIACGRL